ncbi:flagellar biosynthetic protein FliR [Oceanibacterium hippocampi]|uniref:Flagellar biosynthetic protein FliR n=1 Tax=Oceanibacterium hippocampi TaxID=745714 RepID=A0A1Y5U4L5_9PROT|nr:flagellar biosynthetic protein FliR [Oceanibacterium hippocampi]SLN76825.1 flagellar biosynthesis protein FliR [Oceanibacterium hippocampi]
MLQQLLPAGVFAFFIVFARIGSAFMVVPGFSEGFVPPRVRLVIAIGVSLLVLPLVVTTLPALPSSPAELALVIGGEILIGLLIGGVARLAISGLHTAGMIIAHLSSLAAAQFFDPAQQTQGALVGSFLTLIGLVLIFVTDMHHLFIMGAAESYRTFPPAALPAMGDFAGLASDLVAGSFRLGVQISAPFIVYGLTLYIGAGLINRLMPQVQVFFVMMPLQIALAFLVLSVTLGAIGMWFIDYYRDALGLLTGL